MKKSWQDLLSYQVEGIVGGRRVGNTFSSLEEGRASPQSSDVHRSDQRGCWAKWWQGRDTWVTKRTEGSLLGAQGQSGGEDGYRSQISGILSYLLPLPHTPFQLPNTPNCYHHRGSREKCASQHPMEKMENPHWHLYYLKVPLFSFSALNHCHYVSWAPNTSLYPLQSPLSIPIIYQLKCKPTYLFIWYSSLPAIWCQPRFPSTSILGVWHRKGTL